MTTKDDCITYSSHTEQYDGQDVHVERWGTERTYLEAQNGELALIVQDCADQAPIGLAVGLDHLRELHQVLGWFLMNQVHQGECLTLGDVQAMAAAELLGGVCGE
jgi:hypothetical protein